MPEGVVIGGWSYVIAAYGITITVLVAYAYSLKARRRRNRGSEDRS